VTPERLVAASLGAAGEAAVVGVGVRVGVFVGGGDVGGLDDAREVDGEDAEVLFGGFGVGGWFIGLR